MLEYEWDISPPSSTAPFIVCRGSEGTYKPTRNAVEQTCMSGDVLGHQPMLDVTAFAL